MSVKLILLRGLWPALWLSLASPSSNWILAHHLPLSQDLSSFQELQNDLRQWTPKTLSVLSDDLIQLLTFWILPCPGVTVLWKPGVSISPFKTCPLSIFHTLHSTTSKKLRLLWGVHSASLSSFLASAPCKAGFPWLKMQSHPNTLHYLRLYQVGR